MLMTILLILIGGFTVLYLRAWKKFRYFSNLGIPEEPAYFPFGSKPQWKMLSGRMGFNDMLTEIYLNNSDKKMVGHYGIMGDRSLMINDMDLIKDVLIKDFDHFVDRREIDFSSNKYLANMLTILTGDKWKSMRSMSSPIFTSGKLKGMVPLIDHVGDRFVQYLEKYEKDGIEFESKELFTHFTLEVIGSCGFGISIDSFNDPDGVFNDNVKKLTRTGKYQRSFLQIVGLMISFFFPKIAKLFNIKFIDDNAMNFFIGIIKKQLADRKEKARGRNDFIDTLTQALEAANKEIDEAEEEDQFDKDASIKVSSKKQIFTKEELETVVVSNAFLLFFAGFDTSSSAMALAAFFLAKYPDCQEQLYQEINDAVQANDGNQHLDYQTVQNMKYLEMCINEAIRCYPLTNLERLCVKDYKFRDTDMTIPAGVLVQVPAVPLMKDERYFKNPKEFNPENFSEEAVQERGPYPFMGFGHGPRNCVGKRFALLQVKIALARLIYNYKVIPCSRTVDELKIDPMSSSQQPKGGLWIKVVKREHE